ncbi:DUF1934 domain-containing protein [Paenibacillus thermotolerans]|uniref:DUF1934 domain-containing protein n=1 Tax=Paenibacillus thermotolerans TaxID=3027807 RepID=UPI0023685701|nr:MULTISPECIES: DUF1934 domain-containing protein [unclassified Paenibacillus]
MSTLDFMNEMKRQVQIRLHTAHDGERQTVRAKGHVYLKGQHTYIRYEEPATEQHGAVTTTIKIADRSVTVIRRGAVTSEQRFVPGIATRGFYETPQASFPLETSTKTLDISLADGIGYVEWTYTLLIGGAQAGRFRLRLVVQEDEEIR